MSVNPYRRLGVYSDEYVTEYRSTDLFGRPPHIYAIADSAFHGMVLFRKDASIIVSGELSTLLSFLVTVIEPHTQLGIIMTLCMSSTQSDVN